MVQLPCLHLTLSYERPHVGKRIEREREGGGGYIVADIAKIYQTKTAFGVFS